MAAVSQLSADRIIIPLADVAEIRRRFLEECRPRPRLVIVPPPPPEPDAPERETREAAVGGRRLAVRESKRLGTIPNFLSAVVVPPPPWADMQQALASFFQLRPKDLTEDADDRDLFGETLLQFHRSCLSPGKPRGAAYQAPVDLVTYAKGIAANVRATALEERRKQHADATAYFAQQGSGNYRTKTTTSTVIVSLQDAARGKREPADLQYLRQDVHDRNEIEDLSIAGVDARAAVRPLIADFDRDELWSDVRAWAGTKCREWFGRQILILNVSAKTLATMIVDGKALTPEEGTWLVLLGQRRIPPGLEPTTATTVEDVYRVFHERVKKAFSRARRTK